MFDGKPAGDTAMHAALRAPTAKPPLWLMRQAGRYLPEYRETRGRAGGFLKLCYTPALATEVTLQPIRRFGFDAAILFSDILVVPDALGQAVTFSEGHGPQLMPLLDGGIGLAGLADEPDGDKFGAVFEAVGRIRAALPDETALIGFCGAPWTVATYMIAGHATPDQAPARLLAYRQPAVFATLIDRLVTVSTRYLLGQIAAGAQLVQIFDSWSGVLAEPEFHEWVVKPTARMVAAVKAAAPHVPIIGFPRGAGALTEAFVTATGVDAVGCDTGMPLAQMRRQAVAVQGNLDPLLLVAGGAALDARIDALKAGLAGRRWIANLGHGIVPETPIEHVQRLVQRLKAEE